MESIHVFFNRFAEAFVACALAMVQGNVTAISTDHLLVASKTGGLTGVAAIICFLFLKDEYKNNKYVIAGLTGFLTAVADSMIHQSHFGGESTEAIVTGIGAGFLCFVMAHLNKPSEVKND